MIDFAKSRADIEAMPGDLIAVPKEQLRVLFDTAERGQKMERLLSSIGTILNFGASDLKATA